jgi:hypothetical protein
MIIFRKDFFDIALDDCSVRDDRCMLEDEDVHLHADPFELFAHATSFLGYKVVLLGRYNAQVCILQICPFAIPQPLRK